MGLGRRSVIGQPSGHMHLGQSAKPRSLTRSEIARKLRITEQTYSINVVN